MWLLRWLLFRFMFLSGAVSFLAAIPRGPTSPRSPTIFTRSRYRPHLPGTPSPAAACTHSVNGGDLYYRTGVPFLIFCPRRLRFIAAFGFILLQLLIMLTGNYTFFNILVLALCLVLFDDAALRKTSPRSGSLCTKPRSEYSAGKGRLFGRRSVGAFNCVCGVIFYAAFGGPYVRSGEVDRRCNCSLWYRQFIWPVCGNDYRSAGNIIEGWTTVSTGANMHSNTNRAT